jgi:hypothetical protein
MPDIVYDCYSIDASVMIRLKDMLPFDIFESAWNEITRLVQDNRWRIFESIANEIHGETIKQWLEKNDMAIVKFNQEINNYTNQLMNELQQNNMMLVDPMSLKNNSDPFVIMLALYLEKRELRNLKNKTSTTKCCILTNEEPKKNKINIPSICDYYDLKYMNLPNFMRHHGWKITLEVKNP